MSIKKYKIKRYTHKELSEISLKLNHSRRFLPRLLTVYKKTGDLLIEYGKGDLVRGWKKLEKDFLKHKANILYFAKNASKDEKILFNKRLADKGYYTHHRTARQIYKILDKEHKKISADKKIKIIKISKELRKFALDYELNEFLKKTQY